MNHKERMEQGLIYNPNLPEITGDQFVYMDKLWEFNQLKPSQFAEKERYMKEMFAECGENCYIELPFRANWGGKMFISETVCMPISISHWWTMGTFILMTKSCSDLM